MKIGEILELTQTMKLSEIAKQYLDVGEKKALEGMKKAGCYAVSGKRGWFYDGDPAVLEQSIYDFTTKTINTRPKANGSNKTTNKVKPTKTNKPKKQTTPPKELTNEELEYNEDFFKMTGEEVPKVEKQSSEEVKRKRMSFDLDIDLMKELKIQGIRDDVPLYEMVENAIRHYLDAKRY